MDPELLRAIDDDHAALDALIRGNAEPKKAMFSRRDDVTLANPLRPAVRGRRAVEDVLDEVAADFRDGEPETFERVADHRSGDLAYVHEIQRGRVKHGGGDELVPFALRVTQVWRLEDDGWRIALRHADPLSAPRTFGDITA
jgi:ketosteroid isomerase-like protein